MKTKKVEKVVTTLKVRIGHPLKRHFTEIPKRVNSLKSLKSFWCHFKSPKSYRCHFDPLPANSKSEDAVVVHHICTKTQQLFFNISNILLYVAIVLLCVIRRSASKNSNTSYENEIRRGDSPSKVDSKKYIFLPGRDGRTFRKMSKNRKIYCYAN